MVDIIVQDYEVWDYFLKHQKELDFEGILIAANYEYGIYIYLEKDDGTSAKISVVDEDREINSEIVVDSTDCKATVWDMYMDYLYNYANEKACEYADPGYSMTPDTAISEREMGLFDAVYYMLYEIDHRIDDVLDEDEGAVEEITDMICEFLYKKHGISVYRPMYLEDDDGKEYFFTHPYEEMDI